MKSLDNLCIRSQIGVIHKGALWSQAGTLFLVFTALSALQACGGGDKSATDTVSAQTPVPAQFLSVDREGVPSGCAAKFLTPLASGCNRLLLTLPEVIAKRTAGIVETKLSSGLTSYRFGPGQHINVKDAGCTQLGKNGNSFSLSMWLKSEGGSAQYISSGNLSQYSTGASGFVISPSESSDGRVTLNWRSADPRWKDVRSVSIGKNEWVYVTFVYSNNGEGSSGSITVNGVTRSGVLHPNMNNANLRLGEVSAWGGSAPFEMADVRSYSRALNPDEIRAHWLDARLQTGKSSAELGSAMRQLRQHFSGQARLADSDFAKAAKTLTDNAVALPTRETFILDALALMDEYESSVAPLFLSGETVGGISRAVVVGESATKREARVMLDVFQAVHDEVFGGETVAACSSKLQGRSWKTADFFPGKVLVPVDTRKTFAVKINATVPSVWGIPVGFAADPKVRPTGLYLPPGSVARVTVPPALVDAGFAVRIGAHSWDKSGKANHQRMHRVMKRFDIRDQVTYVANPLGGGVYIEVPYLAKHGMVSVQVQGVVEAPMYSLRSFDTTTTAQWQARRTAAVPWTDFVTDHYMTQVPSNWVYAKDDPKQLLIDWDKSMKGVSEFVGIPPENRNDVVMWTQVDLDIAHGAYGVGYPQVNMTYNPRSDARGNSSHSAVTNVLRNPIEFHELGHSQLLSKFEGETEALVNFPIVYVSTQKFGNTLDAAFGSSFSLSGFTIDQAALDWMVTVNFGNKAEMNRSNTTKDEFRYQYRGYAKYADIVRLFNWKALTDFYHQENLDYIAKKPVNNLGSEDSRIFQLSMAAGADLTPLIHFWGIHPDEPAKLSAAIAANGLMPSSAIKDLLLRYRTLIPANQAEFLDLYTALRPFLGGNDPDYGLGWYEIRKGQWNTAEAEKARAAIDDIVMKYFP